MRGGESRDGNASIPLNESIDIKNVQVSEEDDEIPAFDHLISLELEAVRDYCWWDGQEVGIEVAEDGEEDEDGKECLN